MFEELTAKVINYCLQDPNAFFNILETVVIIGICLFFISIVILSRWRKVPYGQVLIIDRNGHFLKKVRRGRYFFNPATDKITTIISKSNIKRSYVETFQTFDDVKIVVSYDAVYRTDDIEKTLEALEQSRRSIDDVLNCAVYNVVKNNRYEDIKRDKKEFNDMVEQKARFDVDTLSFILDKLTIKEIYLINRTGVKVFEPHVSASSGAIKY